MDFSTGHFPANREPHLKILGNVLFLRVFLRLANKGKVFIAIAALMQAGMGHAAWVSTAATVHYAVYNGMGTVKASGDVGSGNSWVNDATLTDSQHAAGYMVEFWIDNTTHYADVSWQIDWSLAYGASLKTTSAATISYLSSSTQIDIGSSMADYTDVAGTSIAEDSIGTTKSTRFRVAANSTYSLGAASAAANEKTGSVTWDDGSASTEIWAYVSGSGGVTASSNISAMFANFGNVLAEATVTTFIPDIPMGGGGMGFPGGSTVSDTTGVPEPGTWSLAGATTLFAFRRRRRSP